MSAFDSPHQLGVRGASQKNIEAVDPSFLRESLLEARKQTMRLYSEIERNLVEGIDEVAARVLANSIARDLGATKHWHQPYIRFGTGTTLSYRQPLIEQNILKPGMLVSIDLGPVWKSSSSELEYEGDFGNSFVFGENPEAQKCIDWTRALFAEGKKLWQEHKLTGQEIYDFFRKKCHEGGYRMGEDFSGHRLSDFPHHQYTKERLTNVPFTPIEGAWVLEIQVNDSADRFGAFYEDLLWSE